MLYVVFLGVIGGLMAWESVGALGKTGGDPGRRTRMRAWLRGLPFKRRFPRSGPLHLDHPAARRRLLRRHSGGRARRRRRLHPRTRDGLPSRRARARVMVGTSLFQIIFLTAYVTFLQATFNGTVDLVLAFVLMIGGVIGARIGAAAEQEAEGRRSCACSSPSVVLAMARPPRLRSLCRAQAAAYRLEEAG